MLKLLGRLTSINVRKVAWTADLIGLSYDREDWGLPLRDPSVPEFVKLNPNAQVPVLIEDGFVLWESGAIMRYLADKHAHDLLPADRHERAIVDQWLTWQATELNPTWPYAVQALMRKNPSYVDEARITDSIARWSRCMHLFDVALLRGGGFVANGRMSLADIALALSTHRWISTPFDKPDLPEVMDHYDRLRASGPGAAYLSAATP